MNNINKQSDNQSAQWHTLSDDSMNLRTEKANSQPGQEAGQNSQIYQGKSDQGCAFENSMSWQGSARGMDTVGITKNSYTNHSQNRDDDWNEKKTTSTRKEKKYWPIVLAMVVFFALIGGGILFYFNIHLWEDATCAMPKTCMICGKTEGNVMGHRWESKDCTSPEICSVCGETGRQAVGHKWAPATCTAPETCSVCGETGRQVAGHQWTPATCTAPETCSVCGETGRQAVGHKWAPATYTTPQTCSVCGATTGGTLMRPNPFGHLRIGDTVYFGTFEQDNNFENGMEPIEWIVVDVGDNRALLMSRYGLDCRTYHDTDVNVTWENCSLRQWLNDFFLYTAFWDSEREWILTTNVSADDNPDFSTRVGNATKDKIYLLSTVEAKGYYPDYRDRVCTPTAYAVSRGAFLRESTNGGWWWLRTPGDGMNTAASIDSNGSDDAVGSAVDAQKGMVRPVMWVETD